MSNKRLRTYRRRPARYLSDVLPEQHVERYGLASIAWNTPDLDLTEDAHQVQLELHTSSGDEPVPAFAMDASIAVDLAVSLLETVVASPELLETLDEDEQRALGRLPAALRALAALSDVCRDL
ncbi:hypothetical protein RR21198_4026 [Rhodococcus rhodochrous ATCC 21198]|uniref:hypothetical protein n=1 Tax=Rhodococcus aetherivorans TaxID=191292 RepID=UPI0003E265F6|nr:hypothetical protein [Rhodococcus aetherivorans]ETT25286.1 hypothetical protein RR21198_4026 [Rhodococcus rhodochrous ATCC 21198]NGP28441.1 hypothetical protein [Rhodococcus aetherivorans]